MIRNIIHDPMLLARVSAPSDDSDGQLIQDLKDTLDHHREACVGMAANMIGVYKCVIRIEPPSAALEGRCLSTEPAGEVPSSLYFHKCI